MWRIQHVVCEAGVKNWNAPVTVNTTFGAKNAYNDSMNCCLLNYQQMAHKFGTTRCLRHYVQWITCVFLHFYILFITLLVWKCFNAGPLLLCLITRNFISYGYCRDKNVTSLSHTGMADRVYRRENTILWILSHRSVPGMNVDIFKGPFSIKIDTRSNELYNAHIVIRKNKACSSDFAFADLDLDLTTLHIRSNGERACVCPLSSD